MINGSWAVQEGILNAWPSRLCPKEFKTQLGAVMRYCLSQEEPGEERSMFCAHTKKYNRIKKSFSDTNSICLMPLSICYCASESEICALLGLPGFVCSVCSLLNILDRLLLLFMYESTCICLFIPSLLISINQRLETVNLFSRLKEELGQ